MKCKKIPSFFSYQVNSTEYMLHMYKHMNASVALITVYVEHE